MRESIDDLACLSLQFLDLKCEQILIFYVHRTAKSKKFPLFLFQIIKLIYNIKSILKVDSNILFDISFVRIFVFL